MRHAPKDLAPSPPLHLGPPEHGVHRMLFENTPDAVLVWDEATGTLIDANPAAGAFYGTTCDRLVGDEFDRVHRNRFDVEGSFTSHGASDNTRLEALKCRRTGDTRYVEVRELPVVHDGVPAVLVIFRDVTAERRANRALHESEERYTLVAYGANDGLWDWNLVSNEMYLSPRWKTMLGYSDDEIGNSPNELFARVHPDDVVLAHKKLAAHLEQQTPNFEVEARILHKDGGYHWMLMRGIAVRDDHGRPTRMAGSQTDITERKSDQELLVRRALYDSLTDLPNRALFTDRLTHAVDVARRRTSFIFAVLFIDLDRFKVVNDSLGHLVGDQLLVQIARRLENSVRPSDTFARLGGDEFAILLDGIESVADARIVADRVKQKLQAPFSVAGHTIFTTASIGISVSATPYSKPEDLLREADMAMYRAKRDGKARYEVYNSEVHQRDVRLMHIENELRFALERRELLLNFQPIVDLSSGAIAGFEALIRWQHPERGLVSPVEFIPVAEETGLIVSIGAWVLSESCRELRKWQLAHPDLHLLASVNVSSRQISKGNFPDVVRRALLETDVDASSLKLEITESVLMEHPAVAVETLSELRSMGVALSIDDFGTGYSSLSYLRRFPVNTLKIDRAFVSRMSENEKDLQIVRSILGLARAVDLDVVAEGVETLEQARQLRDLGCEYGQGYYFAKPLAPPAMTALLEQISTTGSPWLALLS